MSAAQVVSIDQQGAVLNTAALGRGTLYEIQDHLGALLDTVDLCESPEQRAECETEIAAFVESLLRKVDSIAGAIAHFEHQQEYAAAEIERLRARKDTYAKREQRLRAYVVGAMQGQEKKRLEGHTSTLTVRACPASVSVIDEGLIPETFKITKTTVSVDKAALRRELTVREVAGAVLVSGKFSLVRS